MKIAYFGYNPLSSCLQVMHRLGHEIVVIYTGEHGQFSDVIIEFANTANVPLLFCKPSDEDMQDLVEKGVELFFSAEYPWKIPVPLSLKYAVNVHPTLLPQGRGQTPIPHLIMHSPEHAGVTLHKMTNEFDNGDILLQRAMVLDENEDYDSLAQKLYIETPKMLKELLADITGFYAHARVQTQGSDWQSLTSNEQIINWPQTTAKVLKHIRAFGSLGSYLSIANKRCLITRATGEISLHHYVAGEVISIDDHQVVIATTDGTLALPRDSIIVV